MIAMTAKMFADKMAEISRDADIESAHGDADDLMCELLKSLGYGEGVDIFLAMNRWYA